MTEERCLHRDSETYGSRKVEADGIIVVVRHRGCKKCGVVYKTTERLEDDRRVSHTRINTNNKKKIAEAIKLLSSLTL